LNEGVSSQHAVRLNWCVIIVQYTLFSLTVKFLWIASLFANSC